jgi:hypothetical protein
MEFRRLAAGLECEPLGFRRPPTGGDTGCCTPEKTPKKPTIKQNLGQRGSPESGLELQKFSGRTAARWGPPDKDELPLEPLAVARYILAEVPMS